MSKAFTTSVTTMKTQVSSNYITLIAGDMKQSIPLLNAKFSVKKNSPLIGPSNQMIVIQTNGKMTIIEIHFHPLFDDQKLFKWNKALSEVVNEMLPNNLNQLGRIKQIHKLSSPLDPYRRSKVDNRTSVSLANVNQMVRTRGQSALSTMDFSRSDSDSALAVPTITERKLSKIELSSTSMNLKFADPDPELKLRKEKTKKATPPPKPVRKTRPTAMPVPTKKYS